MKPNILKNERRKQMSEPIKMTVEELREYIKNLPDGVMLIIEEEGKEDE